MVSLNSQPVIGDSVILHSGWAKKSSLNENTSSIHCVHSWNSHGHVMPNCTNAETSWKCVTSTPADAAPSVLAPIM